MKPEEFLKKFKTDPQFRHSIIYANLKEQIDAMITLHMKGNNIIDTLEEKYRGVMFNLCMQVLNVSLQTIVERNMNINQIKEIRNAININRTK